LSQSIFTCSYTFANRLATFAATFTISSFPLPDGGVFVPVPAVFPVAAVLVGAVFVSAPVPAPVADVPADVVFVSVPVAIRVVGVPVAVIFVSASVPARVLLVGFVSSCFPLDRMIIKLLQIKSGRLSSPKACRSITNH
jgi:hypothetical protein